MSRLYTFWDTIIPYRTESAHFFVGGGLMNSATKFSISILLVFVFLV